jgi:hypothetical protein
LTIREPAFRTRLGNCGIEIGHGNSVAHNWLLSGRRRKNTTVRGAVTAAVRSRNVETETTTSVRWANLPDGTHWTARVTERNADGWKVTVDFVEQNGAPVVREVRVAPRSRATPLGGLSMRRLQALKIQPLLELARETAARHLADDPHAQEEVSALLTQPLLRRPGRRGHHDLVYALLAVEYESLILAGERKPVVAIAKARHLSRARVRDMVLEARRRGLLTPAARGRASGAATPKARRVIDDAEKERRSGTPRQ